MDLLSRIKISLATLLAVLTFASAAFCAGGPPNEYALKSVFLYNFCRFIDWPDSAFASGNDPLVIGVIGDDPFGPMLDEAVAGESFRGRSIRIEHYRSPREIGRCHLLFISASENARVNEILAAVNGRSIVTVGESPDFIARGGMIALVADRNRVRLLINPDALRAARLDASSKLLRVAEIAR
ncbi:MAG: YfiR family protein [Verrucomicrobiota bacterium]|nr:YfiR family protein [Verrucomicrobiota bacterium]